MIFDLFQSQLFNLIFGIALIVIIGHAILKMTRFSSDENPIDSLIINFVVGLIFLGIVYWLFKNKIIELPSIGISGTDILAFVLITIFVVPLLFLLYGLVVVAFNGVYKALVYLKNLIINK